MENWNKASDVLPEKGQRVVIKFCVSKRNCLSDDEGIFTGEVSRTDTSTVIVVQTGKESYEIDLGTHWKPCTGES